MPVRRRWKSSLAILLMSGALVAGALPGAVAAAGAPAPSIRLIVPNSSINVERPPDSPAWFDPGVFLAATGGAFEIRAERSSYDRPPSVTQVIHSGRTTTVRHLPRWVAPTLTGISKLLEVDVFDGAGHQLLHQRADFCPQAQDMRVDPTGPRVSSYPRYCSQSPFARGTVWGIEQGWAQSAFGWTGFQFDGPDGDYRVRVKILKPYVDLFGIRAVDASGDVTVHLTTGSGGCKPKPPCPGGSNALRGPLGNAPTLTATPPDASPDLVALPAWNIGIQHEGQSDFITFAATVWNSGPSPLLVEGYRRKNQAVMDAWQYFMRGDQVVGRRRVGTFEYDPRIGHQHWHFRQFATYSLLDSTKHQVYVSQKEAFCLAPTDAIDMTVPSADWQPGSTGLVTTCGDVSAIWIRETLPAGWGDTYVQYVAGQALDITSLANGTYFVAVEANVAGKLFENDRSNNRALRQIVLGGTPGHRTVQVKPWHGITD